MILATQQIPHKKKFGGGICRLAYTEFISQQYFTSIFQDFWMIKRTSIIQKSSLNW